MNTIIHSYPIWLPQTQTWMYNQVRYLPQKFDCHINCERSENLDQFTVPKIHAHREISPIGYHYEKAMIRLRLRRRSGWLEKNIRATGAELVHSHFGHIAWHDMWACQKTATPQVVTFYGWDVNQLPNAKPEWQLRYQELFKSVAYVLCEGPHMASCIVSLGCSPDKVLVHHLGVALDELPFRPRQYDSAQPLRILIAASFREKKGIPYAIEAVGRIARQTNVAVTIIGDSDGSPGSDKEKQRILEAIDRHSLSDKVKILGFQPHARLLSESHSHQIFLSPSVTADDGDTEGGAPVTIIELAATGMPVVSTRHCDIPEVIQDRVNGLLADERDIDGLERILKQLIDAPGEWNRLEQDTRKHIEESFDARQQGEGLGQIYQNVLSKY